VHLEGECTKKTSEPLCSWRGNVFEIPLFGGHFSRRRQYVEGFRRGSQIGEGMGVRKKRLKNGCWQNKVYRRSTVPGPNPLGEEVEKAN